MTHEQVSKNLFKALQKDIYYAKQLQVAMEEDIELCPEFLGFVKTYYALSTIIPLDRTIYDLGCCSAAQSWYFRKHHKYIGVDMLVKVKHRIHTPNSEHFQTTIEKYLNTNKIDEIHFAICNYVPPWQANNEELTRKHFEHLFVYYPRSKELPIVIRKLNG